MKGALDVHRELLARDLPHEIVRLRRSVLSAEEIPAVLGLPAAICVCVRAYVVVADGRPDRLVAVGLPAGQVAEPDAVLSALDACAVRAATNEQVNAATDFSAPLVPPVALPDEVDLLLDAAFEVADVVYTATGEAGTALGIHLRDLIRATTARVTPLTGALGRLPG
ncbi:MAG: hypothetical protein M3Z02_05870 [Actinomycetota bacterium]|nr:hypothetical protein [Actinomycetota bacterium]